MIRVRVRYCAQARVAAGISEEEVSLNGSCVPAELLKQVAQAHGELRRVLLDGNEKPHPSVLVFIDSEQVPVNSPQALKDGDVVEILPPMSGG